MVAAGKLENFPVVLRVPQARLDGKYWQSDR
jgi:hypothetical protein